MSGGSIHKSTKVCRPNAQINEGQDAQCSDQRRSARSMLNPTGVQNPDVSFDLPTPSPGSAANLGPSLQRRAGWGGSCVQGAKAGQGRYTDRDRAAEGLLFGPGPCPVPCCPPPTLMCLKHVFYLFSLVFAANCVSLLDPCCH